MDKLYILTGPLQGAMVELLGEKITVGRSSDNDICLDDESVSEHHATLVRHERDWIVQDKGSAKGTFVRDERVVTATLEDGDKVSFGTVKLLFETSEKKLHLPGKQGAAPISSRNATPPPRRRAGGRALASSLKSAVFQLVQLAAFVAVAGGAYVAYQRLSRVEPPADPARSSNVTATLPASTSSAPVQAVLTVPATNQQVQLPAEQPRSGTSEVIAVQPAAQAAAPAPGMNQQVQVLTQQSGSNTSVTAAVHATAQAAAPAPAATPQAPILPPQPRPGSSAVTAVQPVAQAAPPVPATKPCRFCNGTGGIRCRWCKDGKVDCPGPCLKLSRGKWEHMDVAGHDPKELWQKFQNRQGGYKAWSQAHLGEVVEMQNGEPVNLGPCKVCNGTTHVPCRQCQGTGKTLCLMCRGKGVVPR